MKSPNWVVHNILDKPISFHTHGLDKYGSLEIEIVLPLSPEVGLSFCNTIGAAIADGLKIEDGLMVTNLFANLLGYWQPVYFFKVNPIYGDKEVFRAILTDPNELFPWEQYNGVLCAEGYKDQITFTKDMCFYIVVEDTEKVEEYRTCTFSMFQEYEKRENCYVSPIQYYVADLKELILTGACDVFWIRKAARELNFGLYDSIKTKVMCKPVDYSDPMHKHAKEFIWKYIK